MLILYNNMCRSSTHLPTLRYILLAQKAMIQVISLKRPLTHLLCLVAGANNSFLPAPGVEHLSNNPYPLDHAIPTRVAWPFNIRT